MKQQFAVAIIMAAILTRAADSTLKLVDRPAIRTSQGYIVTGPIAKNGLIKCDEVPHNGDNVKYFTKEDLVKMLALYETQTTKP